MNLNKRISSIFLALLFLFSTIINPSTNADYDSDGIADNDDDGVADSVNGGRLGAIRPIGPPIKKHGELVKTLESDDSRVTAEFGWDMSSTDDYSENAGGRIRTCEPVRTGT